VRQVRQVTVCEAGRADAEEGGDIPKMLFGIFATWALKLGKEIVVG
jgi:hypothetical protein